MIRVSDECYNLMQFNTHFLEYATLTLADNTVLNLTPADFTITNNYIVDGAESNVLPLGVAIEKVIQVEIANPNEKYNEYDFYGATIALQLKLQLSNSVETINKGTYTVIQPVQYGDSIILSAADEMYKADQLISGTITFPITLGSLASALCIACGITLSSSTFTNSTLSMSTFVGDYTQYTYRQMFGFIAQLAGGNARINTSNQLEFISYDKTMLATMSGMCGGDLSVINTEFPIALTFEDDPTTFQDMSIVLYDSTGTTVESWANATLQTYVTDNTLTIPSDATIEAVTDTPCIMEVKWLSAYDGIWHTYRILIPSIKQSSATTLALTKWQTLTIETDDVTITGIQTTLTAEQLAQSDDSASDTILSGTDDYVLEITNPFFNSSNVSTLLGYIATVISGLKIRPFTGEHIANPLVEFMDNVFIVDKRGNVYATVVTDAQFTVLGTTALKNSAEPVLRNKKVYSSQADTAYLKAVESTDKKVRNVTNYFWHDGDGAHVSTVENDATTGPNVLLDSDSLDIRKGTTLLASFGQSLVEIGKNAVNAVVKFCNGFFEIYGNKHPDSSTGTGFFNIRDDYNASSLPTQNTALYFQVVNGRGSLPSSYPSSKVATMQILASAYNKTSHIWLQADEVVTLTQNFYINSKTTTLSSVTEVDSNVPSGSYAGYLVEGKHCYIYARCRLDTAWSSGDGNVTLMSGFPVPVFTQPPIPVMVANALNGVAWVNDSGNLIIKPSSAISTLNFIVINGRYLIS